MSEATNNGQGQYQGESAQQVEQPQPVVEEQQVNITLDENDMRTTYSNMFRTNGSVDEVFLDFGINTIIPVEEGQDPSLLFKVNDRVILNYYSAKRLAIALGQIVRNHEEQFGELELDIEKRRKK